MLSFSPHDEVEGWPLTHNNVDLLTSGQFMGEGWEPGEPSMEINEAALQTLWRKGQVAWAGVPNATEWVEELRR